MEYSPLWLWQSSPRRALRTSKLSRWVANTGIVVINTGALSLVLPAGVVGLAAWTTQQAWGLFNYARFPYWLEVVISVVVLDFVVYLEYVMFHTVPTMWFIRMMHHPDMDFDVTGTRFHPIEILISMVIKASAILVSVHPWFGIIPGRNEIRALHEPGPAPQEVPLLLRGGDTHSSVPGSGKH